MKVSFFALVLYFFTANVLAKLLFIDDKKLDEKYAFRLTNCFTNLLYKLYEGRTLVLLNAEIQDSFGEHLLISGIYATVNIGHKAMDNIDFKKIFLFQPDISNFNRTLYTIILSKEDKSSQFLIVWPMEPFHYISSYVSQVHERFWQNRILRVASLVPTKDGFFNVYTYFPYTDQLCGSGRIVKKVDECTTEGFKNNFNIFSGLEKLKNFHKCSVKCFGNVQHPESILIKNKNGTWDIKGNIVHLLNTLKVHYNLTLNVIEIFDRNVYSYDWFYYNITFQEVSQISEQALFEFGFGSFTFLNNYYIGHIFDYGFMSNSECISWAIPASAGKYPKFWKSYVSEFHPLCWYILGLTVCLATMLLIVGNILERHYLSLFQIFTHLLMMTFSFITAPSALKTKLVSINLFIFQWSVCGLVIRCAYEASLGSIMTVPTPIDLIKSHDDIMEANMKVAGGIKMYKVLRRAAINNQVLTYLANKFEIFPPIEGEEVISKIVQNKNLAVLQPKRYTMYTSYKFAKLHNYKSPVVEVTPCLLQNFAASIIVRKGSIMSELLFTFTQRLFENGLLQYWRSNDYIKNDFKIKPKILNLGKIYGIFILYFIGITVAITIFLIEVIYSKIYKN